MKDYVIIGLGTVLNLFCAWILFGGGAARLEGSSFSWLLGARFQGNSDGWSSGGLKIVAGVFFVFEIGMFLIGYFSGWK